MSDSERLTILIVDDVASNRLQLRAVFEDAYEILEAENGLVALEMLRACPEIAAVVLDIVMPVMDGNEVLAEMRKDDCTAIIPVLVVTGYEDIDNQERALQLGAMDVICKPFNPNLVFARVKNAVDRILIQNRYHESERLKFELEQQKRALEQANFDEMTGLSSKQHFYSEVRRILDANPDKEFAIGRFDLDRFKLFNDSFGVAAGDKLLRDIGTIVRDHNHNAFVLSHLEADHFAGLYEKEDLDREMLAKDTQALFDDYPVSFDFSVKMGIYEIEDTQMDVRVMCDRALLALKSVKGLAGTRVGVYDDSLRQKLMNEQELLSDMNGAFAREELKVWFQPQYDYTRGVMIGAEALVRWQHPKRGLTTPFHFIPIMEKNGLITKLDEYVWEHCCRYLRRWLDLSPEGAEKQLPHISTNISRADMLRPELPEFFHRLTEKYGIPRNMLHLEITESGYLEDAQLLLATVNKLREDGFTVEMDDFGSGYSSLNTLKDVPVDILKLDMHFVAGAHESTKGGSILSSTIRMARWLNLPVIAEGVETWEQAEYLKSIGCRFMQGYYFAKPMPAEDFEPLYLNGAAKTSDEGQKEADISAAEQFWSASNQTALLFNSYLGGACILEYHNGIIEMLRANDRFFEIMETTRPEYEHWMTRMHERFDARYADLFVEKLNEAAESGHEVSFETRNKPLDGEHRVWCSYRIRMLARSADSTIYYAGVENITEKKRAEKELDRQNVLMHLLYNSVPSGILCFRLDGKSLTLINYNDTVWRLLDFENEDAFLQSAAYGDMFSCIHIEDLAAFQSQLNKVISSDAGTQIELEHRVSIPNGGIRLVYTTMQKVVTDSGECFIQFVYNDATIHNEMETQKYGRTLLGFFNEVFELNFSLMTYTQVRNEGNQKQEFSSSDEMIAFIIDDAKASLCPDDVPLLTERFGYLKKMQPASPGLLPRIEYRKTNQNGGYNWFALMPMYVSAGQYLCCITDITVQKEAQRLAEENVRLNTEAQANRTKNLRDRFLLEAFDFTVIDYNVKIDTLDFWSYRGDEPVHMYQEHFSTSHNIQQQYIYEDDVEKLERAFHAAVKKPLAGAFEFRVKEGEKYRYNRMHYMSFADETGEVYCVYGAAMDINDEYS